MFGFPLGKPLGFSGFSGFPGFPAPIYYIGADRKTPKKAHRGGVELGYRMPCDYPKRRSWILVFSRKERKDRKAYRDGGVLQDFQAYPLF